jgi:hypothetical protein
LFSFSSPNNLYQLYILWTLEKSILNHKSIIMLSFKILKQISNIISFVSTLIQFPIIPRFYVSLLILPNNLALTFILSNSSNWLPQTLLIFKKAKQCKNQQQLPNNLFTSSIQNCIDLIKHPLQFTQSSLNQNQ